MDSEKVIIMDFSIKNRKAFLANLLNIGVVLALIVFIAFLFPYQSGPHFEYEVNKPWPYEDFVSPTTFAVYKSDAQISAERESIRSEFLPYFERDTAGFQRSIGKFQLLLDELLADMEAAEGISDLRSQKSRYVSLIEAELQKIYSTGILDTVGLDPRFRPLNRFHVISGEQVRIKKVEDVVFHDEAEDIIQNRMRESDLPDADLLLSPAMESLSSNIIYAPSRTERYLSIAVGEVSEKEGIVEEGEVIVKNGEVVTGRIDREIQSYESEYRPSLGSRLGSWWVFSGYLLLTVYLIALFLLFLKSNAKEVYFHFNQLIFMIVWIALYSYVVSVIDPIENISTYIIPFCVVPIVVKTFFNDRLALFLHLIIILLASYLTNLGYEFMFIEIVAGIATVLSFRIQAVWNRLFTTVGIIFLSYIVSYLGLALIRTGDIADVNYIYFLWFFLSAFLTFLAYPLLPLLERVFRFTSEITLNELADMNHPLLKQLSVEAPGTLQHSLQVGNLAEAAAAAIGADKLSVKVAALYHDIGKMKRPEYFIENQAGSNPHDQLSPKESAEIIIDHVTYGLELAKKHGLPRLLKDFILTHHGTTRVEYFYRKHLAENGEEEVDEKDFTYPGPRPRSKEEAIFMLADSLEASCKSLEQPSYEELAQMIDRIIDHKVNAGQLENTDLSFRDLETARKVFKKMLKSIHHVRVSYDESDTKKAKN